MAGRNDDPLTRSNEALARELELLRQDFEGLRLAGQPVGNISGQSLLHNLAEQLGGALPPGQTRVADDLRQAALAIEKALSTATAQQEMSRNLALLMGQQAAAERAFVPLERARLTSLGSPESRELAEARAHVETIRRRGAAVAAQQQSRAMAGQLGTTADTQARFAELRASLTAQQLKRAEATAQETFEAGAGKGLAQQARAANMQEVVDRLRRQADEMAAQRAFAATPVGQSLTSALSRGQERVAGETRQDEIAALQQKLSALQGGAGANALRGQFADEEKVIRLRLATAMQERAIKASSTDYDRKVAMEAREVLSRRLEAAARDREVLQAQANLLGSRTGRDALKLESQDRIRAMLAQEKIDTAELPFKRREQEVQGTIDDRQRAREDRQTIASEPLRGIREQFREVTNDILRMNAQQKARSDPSFQHEQQLLERAREAREQRQIAARPRERQEEIASMESALRKRQDPARRAFDQQEFLHSQQKGTLDLQNEIETLRGRLSTMHSPQGQAQGREEAGAMREAAQLQRQIAREQNIQRHGLLGVAAMEGAEIVRHAASYHRGSLAQVARGGANVAEALATGGGIGGAAAGMAQIVSAIKEGFDRTTSLASPQEAARAQGTWDIIGAKIGESLLPLRRQLTDAIQDSFIGKRLGSLSQLPAAQIGSVEQISQQMTQRTLNMGSNTVEAELLRIQMRNLQRSNGLLEQIVGNTSNIVPAFTP